MGCHATGLADLCDEPQQEASRISAMMAQEVTQRSGQVTRFALIVAKVSERSSHESCMLCELHGALDKICQQA